MKWNVWMASSWLNSFWEVWKPSLQWHGGSSSISDYSDAGTWCLSQWWHWGSLWRALSYIKPNLHISRDSSISTVSLRALNIWRVLCLTNVLQSKPISIDPGPCLSPWRYWEPYTVVNEGCIQIWIQSKIYVRISSQPPHNWKSFNAFKLNGLAWKAFHILVLWYSVLHTHPFPWIPIDCS